MPAEKYFNDAHEAAGEQQDQEGNERVFVGDFVQIEQKSDQESPWLSIH